MSQVKKFLTEHLDIWTAAETEKKSGRGRASGSAGKVYGIQKLRGLILELAVRGKLVPQDPNDEPASELLNRIQAEKAKLVAEGKLKKEKPMGLVVDDEISFNIPNNWVYARINDTGQYVNGLAFKPNEWGTSGRPIIRIQNLSGRNQDFNRTEKEVDDSVIVRTGDILVSWSATLDVFTWDLNEDGVLNQHIFRVIPEKLIAKSYLYWLLKAAIGEMEKGVHAHGLVMTHINRGPFLAHVIGLPPLPEQYRIVAKLGELMALCDKLEEQHTNSVEAQEKLVKHLLRTLTLAQNAQDFTNQWQRIYAHFDTLFTTEESIDVLKQTLLQLAVMGKLAPQDPNDEPASELLKRIQSEKAKLIAEGKLKKEKLLAPITDEEKPFNLPKGWEWKRLGELFTFEYGDNLPEQKRSNTGEYPVYGSNGIVGTHEKSFVNSKCIVIGRKGSAGALNLSLSSGCCVTDVAYYCVPPTELDLMFTFKLFHTLGLDELGKGIKPGLNRNEAYDLILAIPPAYEQRRIVAKIDELMILCDQLKINLQEAGNHQQKIADVLVAQALI